MTTNNIKDTLQVIGVNTGAIGISLTNINEILTFCSLILAISVTLYKVFYNGKKK